MTRIFVLMGQGGRLTSPGMVSLAGRLKQHGDTTLHSWDDADVIPSINRSTLKIAVVGYSLGANAIGHIGSYAKRQIDLGVAYDPSRLSPLANNGIEYAPNFKRVLCYQNVGAWFFGGAGYAGKNVETVKVSTFHLAIQFDEMLHAKTIAAIAGLK